MIDSPDSEQKRALLTDFNKSDSKKGGSLEIIQDDSCAASDVSVVVEPTSERFWVLFLFGASTCINACGWISVAPVFLLVEDVSVNYLPCLLTIIGVLYVAVWGFSA